MILTDKRVKLGRGRLSSCSEYNGEYFFYLVNSSGIVEKKLSKDYRQLYGGNTVSFSDDFFLVNGKFLERRGEYIFEVDSNKTDEQRS